MLIQSKQGLLDKPMCLFIRAPKRAINQSALMFRIIVPGRLLSIEGRKQWLQ